MPKWKNNSQKIPEIRQLLGENEFPPLYSSHTQTFNMASSYSIRYCFKIVKLTKIVPFWFENLCSVGSFGLVAENRISPCSLYIMHHLPQTTLGHWERHKHGGCRHFNTHSIKCGRERSLHDLRKKHQFHAIWKEKYGQLDHGRRQNSKSLTREQSYKLSPYCMDS